MKKKLIFALIITTLLSCSTKKDILYFQDIDVTAQKDVVYSQNNVQINDILSISVSAIIPETALPYNQKYYSNNAMGSGEANSKLSGYLVNSEGTITFPILGKIEVLGKTINEIEDIIEKKLIDKGQLVEPIVNVRVINAKITILGNVNQAGTFPYYEQNLTLLQAIGDAGDLSMSGKRNDILIIREENGKRTYGRIDLRKTDWFDGPYYYVKQNDIIYVNPNGPMVKSAGYITNLQGVIGLFFTGLSLILLLTR